MRKRARAPLMSSERGFTLIELLTAMAILGLVISAIFALYVMQQRTTYVEADVVDVQENLRGSLDAMARDLRMGGFLVAAPANAINTAGENVGPNASDTITINTASASGSQAGAAVARTAAQLSTFVSTGTTITFNVTSSVYLSQLGVNESVRIIRQERGGAQPVNAYFTITAVDTVASTITVRPSVTVASQVTFPLGSLIVRSAPSGADTWPNTVMYCLGPDPGCAPAVTTCPAGQTCLMRIVNGLPDNDSVLGTSIQGLQLKYGIVDSTAEVDVPADFSRVRYVRITLTGQTSATAALSDGPRSREITTIATLRNRFD